MTNRWIAAIYTAYDAAVFLFGFFTKLTTFHTGFRTFRFCSLAPPKTGGTSQSDFCIFVLSKTLFNVFFSNNKLVSEALDLVRRQGVSRRKSGAYTKYVSVSPDKITPLLRCAAARISAWRTGRRGGPCADRPSCVRLHVRRG